MPRQELLENITPNKYYTIDATLRYMHTTPNYQTAILESNNKQAKIKLLPGTEVELNTEYKFKKCFASSNGWLTEKEAADGGANMETLATNVPPVISRLQDINSQVERYTGIYVSIVLKIVEIEPTKVFLKHGNNLTLDVLKCFGDGFFVNVNLWNKDISSLQVGTWMAFSAFRINLLPNNFYVLFSSVYSNIEPYNGPI